MSLDTSDISDEVTVAMTVSGELSSAVEIPPRDAMTKPAAKKSFVFLVGSLAGGNLASMMLRLIGVPIQTYCATPAMLGLFGTIGLMQGYLPFLTLGVPNGLNRELPYFIGKGDRGRVVELAAAAQAWALIIGSTVCLILSSIGFWQLAHGEFKLAAGFFTNAVLAVLLFYNTYYLQTTYRTSHDFARLAISNVIESAASLLLLTVVALLSFYGLCLRALLTAAVSLSFLYYWRPVRVGPSWNFQHLKHLLVIGVPIFGVGQLYAWWSVLNSTLVPCYMGTAAMGLYATVVLPAGTAMEMLPLAVCQVHYPRIAEQYGRTGQLDDLIRMSIKPTLFAALGMIPLIIVGCLLIDPVVRFLLPSAYFEAIPAIRWSFAAALTQCFLPVGNIYNVVRRQDLYGAAILIGMAAYVGSLLWLVRGGASLVDFPQAMLIGRIVFIIACYLLMYFLARKRPTTT
jgi:O-antigen/teichoic acid export membrane protein